MTIKRWFSAREWALGIGIVWGTKMVQLRVDLLCLHAIVFVRRTPWTPR